MKFNWDEQMGCAVRAHIDALLACETAPIDERPAASHPLVMNERLLVARRAIALPVYTDMAGTLAITPEGAILFYDSESDEIGPITDDRWAMAAAISAAENYADLRGMVPDMPPTAKPCADCDGTGRRLQIKAFCGRCSGLGWLP